MHMKILLITFVLSPWVAFSQLTESDFSRLSDLSAQMEKLSTSTLDDEASKKMMTILKEMIKIYQKDPSMRSMSQELQRSLDAMETPSITASEVISGQRSRVKDIYGQGKFGAPRKKKDGAEYTHNGLDIRADFGEKVYSPIDGSIVMENLPYGKEFDGYYKGLTIVGTGDWEGYTVKVFYVDGSLSGTVRAGQQIGTAQLLDLKFSPGMTNHVHLEVYFMSQLRDPYEIWSKSF